MVLKKSAQKNLPLSNQKQKFVFDTLMKVENYGIYFLDTEETIVTL